MIKYTLDAAKHIMDGTLPYQVFTKDLNTNEELTTDERQIVRVFVNGLLYRYYRYLYSLTAGQDTNLTTEEVLALALYSFNVEKNITTLAYEDVLKELPAEQQVALESAYPQDTFPIRIPQNFHSEDLVLSFASRFSVPLYIVEQLIKDIGKKNILRFLSKRPSEKSGLINEKIINPADFFTKYPQFKQGAKPNMFIYDGKEYIKKTPAYVNNEIILTTQSLLDVAYLIGELNVKKILFVQNEDTSLFLLLALLFPEVEINYSAKEQKSRFILQHLTRKFALTNVHYVTSITATYDLVVTSLTSSNFNGNIRHRDFYFRVNEDLETYAAAASEELRNVQDYVNDNGHLIFLTATALRSETHYQALTFIRDNPAFSLTREKQYFHFNDLHETIYYALLAKDGNVEKA